MLEDVGLVSRPGNVARRPCHLEAEVLDLMTHWIERYRQQAEERFRRLDAVLLDTVLLDAVLAERDNEHDPTGRTTDGRGAAS